MYLAYGDESADESKQRVFALAGIFGSESDWDALKKTWGTRTGGKIFHATDCDTDQGDYKHTDHRDNKQLYADLTQIIAASNLLGHAAIVNLAEYNELIAPHLDAEPYYFAFNSVVIHLGKKAAVCIPRDRVKFKFDRNHQIEHNAAELYGAIIKRPYASRELMDDEVAFVSRKDIGVQAADLVAREAMKWLDNRIGPVSRYTRTSTHVLLDSKRIKFRLYGREWFEKLRDGAAMMPEESYARYSEEGYRQWLSQERLQHTLPNKIRYEATLETIKGIDGTELSDLSE